MSLWFFLNANDQRIGMCQISRQEHLDLTDRDAIADVVCTYTVTIDNLPPVEVKHRYGDGAWPLVRAALNAAFPHRGSAHHSAATTEDVVREMRAAYASGGVSIRALAARHGISYTAAQAIVSRKTWRHVPDDAPNQHNPGGLPQ